MLSLLLIVVLVPTACLLWFMNRAIENERLAMRKTLEDACRRDLSDSQERLEQFWQHRVAALEEWALREPASAVFAQCLRSGWADSVVCYDGQGRIIYPNAPATPSDQTNIASFDWVEARRLEYSENDPTAAAKAYAAIARETNDVNLAARALQAQARCLVQSGNRESAIALIANTLSDEKYYRAVDLQGRLIVPNAQLMALQLISKSSPLPLGATTNLVPEGEGERTLPATGPHPASPGGRGELIETFHELAQRLQKRLEDYNDPSMSGSQRRFLMQELRQLLAEPAELLLLPAEDLAARFIELNISPRQDALLHPSPLPGVWQLAVPSGRLVALWRTETILSQSNQVIAQSTLPDEVAVALRPPDAESPGTNVFYSLLASKYLPGWQLALSWPQGSSSDAVANRRIAIYLWTGILVITAIGVLAGFMAQVFRIQMRHARLKNDLVATVSHELKTPLSSIRLLVDTLLDDQSMNLNKTREYLQLIAKENMRLSRLIDNFLAFSRMERNKQAFQFSETYPSAIINEAVESVRERFEQPSCRLEIDVASDLPPITADVDALITVVLNLLDNAYKYTGDNKHIRLQAYYENGNVCIAVTDNGIGFSRAAAKKIFQRFYQVDRRLSRAAGGCGLGLSIVKFIVDAHGGTIEVDSRPNNGSTFTVKLPRSPINVY